VGSWQATGEERFREAGIRVCRAMLGDLVRAGDEELRDAMDSDRGFTTRSKIARDAAYHFALLYTLTDEKAYAHKAAVLLARFAEVMPSWPLMNPHYGPMAQRKLRPRDWPDYHRTDRVTGVWWWMDLRRYRQRCAPGLCLRPDLQLRGAPAPEQARSRRERA